MTKPLWTLAIALALGACGSAMNKETRADITAQMFVAKPPIEACYTTELQSNRRLRGKITVSMVAAPSTGQFSNIQIVHDELRNPAINDCVVAELGKLRLTKPKKSALKFEYPLRFAPNK
jgi:hypothetical protein